MCVASLLLQGIVSVGCLLCLIVDAFLCCMSCILFCCWPLLVVCVVVGGALFNVLFVLLLLFRLA